MARRRKTPASLWSRPLATARRSGSRLTRTVLDTLQRQTRQASKALGDSAARLAREAQAQARRQARRAAAEAGRAARRAAADTARRLAAAARAQARRQAALTLDGRWLPGAVAGPAGLRAYRLFLPATATARRPVPLLVMLHGCQQDAEGFAHATRMNRVAARAGFAVLYPEQDRLANAQGCWNWFDTRRGRAQREADTVLAAVDQVAAAHPVQAQVFGVAGLSAGASLAALLALRHAPRIAAVAMHAGVAPGRAASTATALRAMRGSAPWRDEASAVAAAIDASGMTIGAGAPWPPLLVLQGDADLVVSARNADQAAALWAAAAGAVRRVERPVQRGERLSMLQVDHVGPGTRLACRSLRIAGLGHAWSGGLRDEPYSDARGPDASRLIWAWVARALR